MLAIKSAQWFTQIWPSEACGGSRNDCNLSLQIGGRRVVDFRGVRSTELQGRSRQVGLHNMPSSPASPTRRNSRKAVSFLSFQPRCPAQNKRKPLRFLYFREPQGLLCYFFSYLHLFINVLNLFHLSQSAASSAYRP